MATTWQRHEKKWPKRKDAAVKETEVEKRWAKKKMMMKKKKKMVTRKEKRGYEEKEQEEEAREEIDPLFLCSSHAANTHATGLFHPDALLNEVLAGGSSAEPLYCVLIVRFSPRIDNFSYITKHSQQNDVEEIISNDKA